jgi:hypothetical protein
VALQGVGMFGDDAELLPALRGVCVCVGGCLVVAVCFGEDGGCGYLGVVGVGGVGLKAGGVILILILTRFG